MVSDLEKSLDLAKSEKGAPNFLPALALCCYIEYWGRLIEGIPIGNSARCFRVFFGRLGLGYSELLKQSIDVYHDVRCGLAHSYLVEGTADINVDGHRGVEYDPSTKKYHIAVRRYLEDFKRAVDDYVAGLESGKEDVGKFLDAMKGKAVLL